ncbi:MAG TPA: PH domain-containing protein [Pseudobacteroides sp.]|uniref:PH domain-containing protein n=1 Tax=Pseudobacteroides sp. TaxID=1968840 RepID=UPI002F959D18
MNRNLELPEQEILWKDRKRTIFGLPLSFTRYRLYEDRLVLSKGFLNVVEEEVMLFRILDFKVKLSLGQRIFRVGTVELTTSDATNKELLLLSIKKPREVKQLLSDKVMEQRKIHGVRGYDSIEAPGDIS